MNKKIGKALVVGAGISGIRSALDLAETGYGVTLIDRAPHIGGILTQLDNQFPNNHCGMCKMLPLVQRDASSQFCLRKGLFHENIELSLNTEISSIEGEPGNFTVSLLEKPTWIDPDLCVGCGVCEPVCPIDVPDGFNEGLTTRKAIYLSVPHAIPNPYIIDLAACSRCGACETVCPTNAIRLGTDRRSEFGVLVVDDELIVRDSLKEWLADEGFSVDTAESGSAALEKMNSQRFDLLLTDIKMPGMDGVELLREAKALCPDLCILMMTAYATVETAVEAMKIGALDYLIKPFDPEALIPKIVEVYGELEAGKHKKLEVGAIVLCGGTDFFDPADEKNVYGYGVNPNVITSLEFERILSGTGPSGGQLVRPHDGKPVEKIAWFQCVGSRDIQKNADFCSTICCMYAVKESILAKERCGDGLEAAVFYMDMRAFGKSFQRYREKAEKEFGVRFERARMHSVIPKAVIGDPMIRYVQTDGTILNETFDLVVLAVGQRPAHGTSQLVDLTGTVLNPWGFIQTESLDPTGTGTPGIFVGGAFSGLKDISESVVSASAASSEASRLIHSAGGSLSVETSAASEYRDVSREYPKILTALCTCGGKFSEFFDSIGLVESLEKDPYVDRILFFEQCCTASGWEELAEAVETSAPNRMVIGACHPYLYVSKLKELGRRVGLDPSMMDVADIMTPVIADWAQKSAPEEQGVETNGADTHPSVEKTHPGYGHQISGLHMAISRFKHIDPMPAPTLPVSRRALVVGGGIAGMHAALVMADHGYPVDLVEKADKLGGNLNWLHWALTDEDIQAFLADTVSQIEKHPHITIHMETNIISFFGEVGSFYSTIEKNGTPPSTIEHGAVILATGGREAKTESYGYGLSKAVVTLRELESGLSTNSIDAERLASVVMIQCVESREEPRNYCSRVCCPTSIKLAMKLKKQNQDLSIYVLYRDIMTPGFMESHFTKAREAGICFIPYDPDSKPKVSLPEKSDGSIAVKVDDPVLGRALEIEADLLCLAVGIVPSLPSSLASALGAETDQDGFFKEAESKWRPVDALKEGIFACGLALSPRSIPESIATAGAAAQRALRILSHENMPTGKIVATVRHALCSLCERCIDACPYGARKKDPSQDKVVVNPAMCQGCGDCAATCPNSAAMIAGFTDRQTLDIIDSALSGGDVC